MYIPKSMIFDIQEVIHYALEAYVSALGSLHHLHGFTSTQYLIVSRKPLIVQIR